MLVKCVHNKQKHLPEDCTPICADPEWDFWLELNKYYIVYAMTIRSNYVWYYVCDKGISYYPSWKPAPLFEVIDGSISKYWIFSFIQKKEIKYIDTTWAYPEWANAPNTYYGKLTDGDEEEVEIFKQYKRLMDLEFPDPLILDYAKALDKEWLLCEYCIDAWKSTVTDQGMVCCPVCERMMHNPRYQAPPQNIKSWLKYF